ncbi:MAG: galactitol-1-phosphate 5-dehydrogenase [Sphaerochaetaceae bacterium]|jgi:threonine dehydrogenase-like Zn-dependent dehydrogenase|nr:galactitol-1-phosphate 5-dehydrogenase [Sphaerochaetaceae bacterium]MDD3163327.1 galactitol-1-phosphate 5-dehydrogenase [Sphaerochaetaceae bacterium]MDD4007423.1 galactitol-1-phosphate 5-dehydrogenase [Sphaerochaetaceae bacterium]MDD4396600.1 galactitol-1-phosphate 5-dehydrogenase [Sphaerochaetaceae bacterium]
MKALVMREYKKLSFEEIPKPEIVSTDEVLIKVKAAAICGSDVHGFDGSTGRRKPPVVMGHEGSGVIEAVGKDVKGFVPGDRVTFDSTIYCGKCPECKTGNVNLCRNRKVLGVSCDEYNCQGIFAEYVVVPERILYHIADATSFEEAALTEPSGVAAHAVRLTPIELNDNIAVIGCGIIGQLIIKILRPSCSGRIIAMDIDPEKQKAALQAGSDLAMDSKQFDHSIIIDRVFEAVGIEATANAAVSIVRNGGSVTQVGNLSQKISFPLQAVVTRQIKIIGSCAICGEYPIVLDMMAHGKLDVKPLISRVVPLSEGQIWFDKLYNRTENLLKVVMIP